MKTNEYQKINDIDRIIHEPSRLLIMAILSALIDADFIFLLKQTGMTRGNLSSHMSKLEDAGYIYVDKEFIDKIPRTLYKLTGKGRKALFNYQQHMKSVLNFIT
jgi:DNA-binding transcriptional ArsR family regulator